MVEQTGTCKHGEFNLREGCSQCIAETQNMIEAAIHIPIGIPSTLVTIKPETDTQVMAFYNEAISLREFAQARVIICNDDLKPANDDLVIIRKIKRGMEERRKEYLKPFQDHVKETNEAYKILMEPIEQADKITTDKMLAYQADQNRIRREQEEINRLRMEAARKDAALNQGEISEPVNLVEVMPDAPTTIRTDMGMTGTAKIRKWEVEDLSKVPLDYLMIDAAKVGKVVRAGIPSIPGIKIWLEDTLRVTAR